MSNTARIAATAANTLTKPLNIEDVFSTYLYDGQSTTLAVNNGIDLAAEDGMTWIKCRNAAEDHFLFSSLQNGSGQTLFLRSNLTNAATATNNVSQTSTGFSLPGGDGQINQTGNTYASWTFRKAPKFFDVVTYTGNGTSGQTINHSLGSVPGLIIVKATSVAQNWYVSHRYDPTQVLQLNRTDAAVQDTDYQNLLNATTTTFTADYGSNFSGRTYVAYLFAHNDGDGDFGPDGDADIIKCGSYTGNGSGTGPDIDLGFEPQWIMVKRAEGTGSWGIYDIMRKLQTGTNPGQASSEALYANTTSAADTNLDRLIVTPTGFSITVNDTAVNASGETYIYIAIRRGPMAVPESATDVFDAAITTSGGKITTGFVTDMSISNLRSSNASYNSSVADRLRGNNDRLLTSSTAAEQYSSGMFLWDYNDGMYNDIGGSNQINWMWKRAPNYFDVVAYTGTGSTMTINHNLGVTPEMIWTKRRDSTGSWIVYHSATGLNKYLFLNSTAAVGSAGNYYAVSDTTFGAPFVNSGGNFISYLFASLDGVSKVGSFVINNSGGTLDINCGFASGARFVLFKRSSGVGAWYVFDSERGITANADPYLELNSTNAEDTWAVMTPLSSGFTIANNGSIGSGTYIFYAIA